jgi:H(+)-translocating pyrophosphatase
MVLSFEGANAIIMTCCFLGLVYALFNAWLLGRIKLQPSMTKITESYNKFHDDDGSPDRKVQLLLEVGHYIEKGAITFLVAEYKYISVFIVILAIIIFFVVETTLGQCWTTVAFITGACTSLLAGYIGMRVACFSNYRCSYKAQSSMTAAFKVAYGAGCVMGFTLVSLGVLILTILIAVYNNWYVEKREDIADMYDKVAAYGLGGSTMALFGRVGGGIFTKAADVGADLVGKVEQDLNEDSPYNPATIADNVGDNVGDIAGMGSDLFGSFAESTCAALVVAANTPSVQFHPTAIYYPIMISAMGIIVCIFTTMIAVFISKTESFAQIGTALKIQLGVSTLLLIPVLYLAAYITLPENLVGLVPQTRHPWHAWVCSLFGLVSGMIIGFFTEYYTSHSYGPVREVAGSCETGAATNIIYGLALGHFSTVVPIVCLGVTAYISHVFMGMLGVALAALGMLSNLALSLSIDAYGPVSDNAGGLAEMCQLGEDTRRRTDALDAAGNTTAAIGKGFAIGSAALVSLALYGAYLTRASKPTNKHPINTVDVISPLVFSGLIIGAMLPYAFSAMTMKSVGRAALKMVQEIRRQIREKPGILSGTEKPDYDKCIEISTNESLVEMILPGLLVLGTPFAVGIIIGPEMIAGLLPGALVSGVSMATSSANSGGAWDNAKKYIESGQFTVNGIVIKKGTEEHKAAVIGDTVGDPLKDTSGPALNILVKLMAIFSLVFAMVFDQTAYFQCDLAPLSKGCPVIPEYMNNGTSYTY